MKLTDYKPNAARHILIYGEPKCGKTELAGSLAAMGKKLVWFDLEDGIKTLLRSDSAAAGHLENVELIKLPDSQGWPIAVETILKVAKGGLQKICHKHGQVNCARCVKAAPLDFTSVNVDEFNNEQVLVIDSVSGLASSVMNHIKRKDIALEKEDIKPDWDDYAKQGFLMDRIMSIFQHAPYNVICISHATMVEMEDKKKRLVPIGGTSNFSKTFSKYFDDVVYCEFVNGKYKAYSDATQNSSAIIGSRSGKKLVEGQGLRALFE